MTSQVEELADRILRINWESDFEHVRSRVALMREYLRRSALWADVLGAAGWPFFDPALVIAPRIRADKALISRVAEDSEISHQFMVVGDTCQWALHMAAVRASGVHLPSLPDMFEPLIRMYEKWGGFTLSSTGTVDVDGAGVHRGTMPQHLSGEPRAQLDATYLDGLDG